MQVLNKLHTLEAGKDDIPVPINLFVEVHNPGCLLATAGMHSIENSSYQWFGTFLLALEKNFRTDSTSKVTADTDREATATAQMAAEQLLRLIKGQRIKMFESDQPRVHVAP